jgi:hypothetical protein
MTRANKHPHAVGPLIDPSTQTTDGTRQLPTLGPWTVDFYTREFRRADPTRGTVIITFDSKEGGGLLRVHRLTRAHWKTGDAKPKEMNETANNGWT